MCQAGGACACVCARECMARGRRVDDMGVGARRGCMPLVRAGRMRGCAKWRGVGMVPCGPPLGPAARHACRAHLHLPANAELRTGLHAVIELGIMHARIALLCMAHLRDARACAAPIKLPAVVGARQPRATALEPALRQRRQAVRAAVLHSSPAVLGVVPQHEVHPEERHGGRARRVQVGDGRCRPPILSPHEGLAAVRCCGWCGRGLRRVGLGLRWRGAATCAPQGCGSKVGNANPSAWWSHPSVCAQASRGQCSSRLVSIHTWLRQQLHLRRCEGTRHCRTASAQACPSPQNAERVVRSR